MTSFDLLCVFCTQSIEKPNWVFVNFYASKCTHVIHKRCHEMALFESESVWGPEVPEKCPAEGCTALIDDQSPAMGVFFIDQWGAKFGGRKLEGYFLERLQWGVNRYWKLLRWD